MGKTSKLAKLGVTMLGISLLLLQGCGGKDTITDYDGSQGTSVEQMIQDKLNSLSGDEAVTDEAVTENTDGKKSAKDILAEMTLEEKVYQMFIVTPEALTGYDVVNASTDITKGWLEKYPVGGLIYFADNILNYEQTEDMLKNTMASALELQEMPIFLCVDEEGGRVVRVAGNSKMGIQNVGTMQNIADKDGAYSAGATIGAYLKELGFTVDMAPVADVITNEKNTVIGDRSFGTDASIVDKYADAYSDGLHSQGILSTYKHFPGHGATEGDTHEGYAYTNKTYEELKEAELVPFANAKQHDIDMVMVAHIAVPNITGDNTPCTLSHKMVTEILRNDLKYDGLIITDAMNMGAITEHYTSKDATVKAIQAGVDIVLMPQDFVASVEGVLEAVKNGEITEDRINESVLRIIEKKFTIKTEEAVE